MADNATAIVVGGGIVGLACAHYLRQTGIEVTIVEKGHIAAACSQSNCGYICPSHVAPLTEPSALGTAARSLFNRNSAFRVKPQWNLGFWNWMSQFARRCTHAQVLRAGKSLQAILDASKIEYQELAKVLSPQQTEWKDDGLLYVLQTNRGMDAFAKHDELTKQQFGVLSTRLDGDALTRLDGGFREGLAGAFHYPGDSSVRPEGLNQAWAGLLKSNGVKIIEQCEVSSLRKDSGHVVALQTNVGELSADQFVFAMGAWSKHWENALGCKIPIQPGKGYSVTIERPGNSPTLPALFPEHKVGISPYQGGLRLGSMMEFVGFDDSNPETRIKQLRDSTEPYVHCDLSGEAKATWYGWRPMTWDSLPIIGATKGLKNAFLATGHNMLGLSLATSTGRLISELMSGQKTHIDPSPYSPLRF